MKQVEERYINLLTDFGFKRIFGTAMNKDLLICFLNSLFNGRQVRQFVRRSTSQSVSPEQSSMLQVWKNPISSLLSTRTRQLLSLK